MSEAFINSIFLALSGGFQDAKELNQEDKLVAKILDYHAPDEEDAIII